jgi:hypothetical protein
MSLTDLQKSIDDSIAKASPLMRGLFEANRWNAEQLQSFANEVGSMIVATVSIDGSPHVATQLGGCANAVLYFAATPHSALLGNVRRDARIAFAIGASVVGRGVARLAGRAGELKDLAPSFGKDLRKAIEQDWDGYVYSIELDRIFAQAA